MKVRKSERWLNKTDRPGPPVLLGDLNPMKNPLNKLKLSIINQGRTHSSKIRQKSFGRIMSEDTKKKKSESVKGIKNPMYGKTN